MNMPKVGGWGRIVRPRNRGVWHEVHTGWNALPWAGCGLHLDVRYSEFADTLPEGARACLLCAKLKAKEKAERRQR